MTTVIHIKDAPSGFKDDPQYVYVGRPRSGMPLKEGIFGNPFPKGSGRVNEEDKGRTREEAVEAYRRYAEQRVQLDPTFARAVAGLKGKTLVCFCKPKLCHGDVLAEMAEVVSAPPEEKDEFLEMLDL
jgi:hypothetical protein